MKSNLPIIDWDQSIKLAGNKKDIAEEMLSFVIKNLTSDISAINQLHERKNYEELLRTIHKLHGALCYCGLPRLKNIVARLETELKNNIMFSLPALLSQLDTEVNLVLKHYPSISF